MQGPAILYVDNARTSAPSLERMMPGVKVLDDPTHLMRRYIRALPSGHAMVGEQCLLSHGILCLHFLRMSCQNVAVQMIVVSSMQSMTEGMPNHLRPCLYAGPFTHALSEALFIWHQPDIALREQQLRAEGIDPASKPTKWWRQRCVKHVHTAFMHAYGLFPAGKPLAVDDCRCRRSIAGQHVLEERLQQLMSRIWRDAAGKELLTPEVWRVHENALVIVRAGRVSGESCQSCSCGSCLNLDAPAPDIAIDLP